MKEKAMKKTIVLLAATLAATAAMAQTNQVLSKNAVGYVRVDIPKGKFDLVAEPFVQIGGAENFDVGAVFDSNSVPQSTQALLWNPTAQSYVIEVYDTIDGWSPGTNQIHRGQSFFVKIPAGYTGTTYSVYMMGEVPTANNTVTLVGGQHFNAAAYSFPAATFLTNSAVNNVAGQSDQLVTWQVGTQSYAFNVFDSIDGWTDPTAVFTPGHGFFYKRAGTATNWVDVKPYTWP